MSTSHPLLEDGAGDARTLGALLYRDPSQARVSEAAWTSLVAAVAAGDARALHQLYQLMHGYVFTLALRIGASRTMAEEVTLDVYQEIWRSAGDYSPAQDTVAGWIMNIARSRALEQAKFRLAAEGGSGVMDIGLADWRESAPWRHIAAAGLTEQERLAVELAYFSDLHHGELARRLGVPVGTIRSIIRSGVAKLRCAPTRQGEL